jgi:hypothetical protein
VVQTKLDYNNADDGVFWMAFEDFVYRFDTVYLCRIFNQSEWTTDLVNGEWKGESAAGCGNFDHFNLNPQVGLMCFIMAPAVYWLVLYNGSCCIMARAV